MITRPLELESRLSPPPRDLDFVAWVNVALIVLFFSLLGSRFVLVPGLLIGEGSEFALPATPGLQYFQPGSLVVSYRQDDVIIFDGAFVKLPELRQRLEAYAKQHPGEVLQLLADKHVSAQALMDVATMAHSVGFAYVLLPPGKPPAAENRLK